MSQTAISPRRSPSGRPAPDLPQFPPFGTRGGERGSVPIPSATKPPTTGTRKQEVTYLPDGFRGPPGWPPPQPLLLRPSQGLTESGDTGSNPIARSPLAWPLGPRPAEDEANVTAGRSPPSRLGTGEPIGDSPRRRVWEGRAEKTLATLTTSAALLRLPRSGLGSLSVLSFGPTSGAQRWLIVRDWETGVAPAGELRRSRRKRAPSRRAARLQPRPARPRPRSATPTSAAAAAAAR